MGSLHLYGGWEWEGLLICSERTDAAKSQALWLPRSSSSAQEAVELLPRERGDRSLPMGLLGFFFPFWPGNLRFAYPFVSE